MKEIKRTFDNKEEAMKFFDKLKYKYSDKMYFEDNNEEFDFVCEYDTANTAKFEYLLEEKDIFIYIIDAYISTEEAFNDICNKIKELKESNIDEVEKNYDL